jgi:hypothetical protein
MKEKKGRIGSSHDDYLKEEGIYEEVSARAIKRVIARQLDAHARAGIDEVGAGEAHAYEPRAAGAPASTPRMHP